ncbi:hypothetical protein D3C75_637130 [compost metagenome]
MQNGVDSHLQLGGFPGRRQNFRQIALLADQREQTLDRGYDPSRKHIGADNTQEGHHQTQNQQGLPPHSGSPGDSLHGDGIEKEPVIAVGGHIGNKGLIVPGAQNLIPVVRHLLFVQQLREIRIDAGGLTAFFSYQAARAVHHHNRGIFIGINHIQGFQ